MTVMLPPTIPDLRRAYTDTTALKKPAPGSRSAAIALVFLAGETDLKLCVGRRALDPADPWSGDLAFPGGKSERVDDNLHDTAARETMEEVGLALPPDHLIGHLEPLYATGGRAPLETHPLIYLLERPPSPFVIGPEFSDAQWISVDDIWNPTLWFTHYWAGTGRDYPAVKMMNHFLWGFSMRVLETFADRIGRPLPADQIDG